MAPSSKVQNSTTACIWYLFFRKSTCEKHVQIMVQITQESHGAVMICPQKRVHHFRPHYALHHRCLNSGWCAKYVPLLDSSVVLLMKGADKKRNKNHFCAMGDHQGYLFWVPGGCLLERFSRPATTRIWRALSRMLRGASTDFTNLGRCLTFRPNASFATYRQASKSEFSKVSFMKWVLISSALNFLLFLKRKVQLESFFFCLYIVKRPTFRTAQATPFEYKVAYGT